MTRRILTLLLSGIRVLCGLSVAQIPGDTVIFPAWCEPVQITKGNKEHLFASYYGINSFSASERYVTVLETEIRNSLPSESESATLGLVDLHTNDFIPLAVTCAWNFQQGCMAHWLGSSPDSLIIYNDFRKNTFLSVIMNVMTRKEIRTIPHPVAAVSPNGKEALSINFARLRIERPDYGYGGGGQNARQGKAFPDDDGLFLVNLESGKSRLLVSYDGIVKLLPEVLEGKMAWINHALFSRDGSRVFFLVRQKADQGWLTTSFTMNRDGTGLRLCFPPGWGGSHFDWLDGDRIMITANWNGKQFAHILFHTDSLNYQRLGRGVLDYDGHGTFSPDGQWMVTDTYPGTGMREQKIYLMDMKSQALISLGRFNEPEQYSGYWRCDLHCRWSPRGDMLGFNSTHSGSRQVYLLRKNLIASECTLQADAH